MRKKLVLILVCILGMLTVGCSKKEEVKNEKNNSAKVETEEKKIPEKTYKIAILQYVDHVSLDAAKEGFIEELRKEGIEAEITEKSANGDMALTPSIAQSTLSEDVDLVYAIATPTAQGAKNVIKDKPIIFSAVTDPVGAGLVESMENPNTNVSGVSDYINPSSQVDGFLKLYPNIKTFGVLYNTSEQNSQKQVEELEKTLAAKGIKLEKVGVNSVNDIAQAIASLTGKIDALFALTDNMVANAAPIVAENLIKNNIPSLSAEEGQVKNGLLMSEGVNYYEQGAQAGRMAIKVLKGQDIKTTRVEYNEVNTKLINKNTATALKIDLNNESIKDAKVVGE